MPATTHDRRRTARSVPPTRSNTPGSPLLSSAGATRGRTCSPQIAIVRETHEPPESVARALELAGGKNPLGEPNYRAVWGWNRLAWIGGKFEEHDPSTGSLLREVIELRQEPKYPAVNRWHIEKWLPAEAYGSPRAWWTQTIEVAGGRSIPALGPYPARGEYEHCLTLEGKSGEFVQLTPTAAGHIARAIEWSRKHPRSKSRSLTLSPRRPHRSRLRAFAYDILDDAVPAFHRQPFVTVL